jgi:inositol polyphosphate 5-phosphatase INPP5B/F
MNVAVDPMGPQRTQFWLERIQECFQKHEIAPSADAPPVKYVNICTKSLVGVLLCVYVKESLVPSVSDLRWTTTAVGVMGVMGNKGGVVIRFNLHSTSICFVCAHLAASRNNIEARNSDYRNIMERSLLLPLSQNHLSSSSPTSTSSTSDPSSSPTLLEKCTSPSDGNISLTILEHDLIFWIGDFNYRIDVSLSLEDIMELLQKENLHALRKKDQLNLERDQGNVFQGFEEALLTFPPTYKFQPGTDVYETRPEKKLRPPAWCDRILWRDRTPYGPEGRARAHQGSEGNGDSKEGKGTHHSSAGAIQNKNYLVSKLRPSDHKPVSASFSIETRVVDPEKEKLEYLRLVRHLDRMENEIQPKVEVGPLLDLKFHSIRFQVFSSSSPLLPQPL